ESSDSVVHIHHQILNDLVNPSTPQINSITKLPYMLNYFIEVSLPAIVQGLHSWVMPTADMDGIKKLDGNAVLHPCNHLIIGQLWGTIYLFQ
ncbi:MAG TPA: hypothetical protein VN455_06035, partial [Methanotrichaceae archaeon]|nr:hypothetical protein [Methanotrichaceae archaeon]